MPKPSFKIKNKKKSILISLTLLTALTSAYYFFFWTSPEKIKIKIKDKTYTLEIARTIAQKTKGLSQRESLCSDCGMIFTYSFEQRLPFWMKDTHIPLDIIWLAQNGRIIHMEKTVPPQSKDENGRYLLYQPPELAQYVIELNAGQADQRQLKKGDLIDLSSLQN